MFYIERWEGKITEAREAPLSPVQDALAKLRLILSRWHLPGGYPFKLAAIPDRGRWTPHQVIFADFKASAKPKPVVDHSKCPACDRPLSFKPDSYSFTE